MASIRVFSRKVDVAYVSVFPKKACGLNTVFENTVTWLLLRTYGIRVPAHQVGWDFCDQHKGRPCGTGFRFFVRTLRTLFFMLADFSLNPQMWEFHPSMTKG